MIFASDSTSTGDAWSAGSIVIAMRTTSPFLKTYMSNESAVGNPSISSGQVAQSFERGRSCP